MCVSDVSVTVTAIDANFCVRAKATQQKRVLVSASTAQQQQQHRTLLLCSPLSFIKTIFEGGDEVVDLVQELGVDLGNVCVAIRLRHFVELTPKLMATI